MDVNMNTAGGTDNGSFRKISDREDNWATWDQLVN